MRGGDHLNRFIGWVRALFSGTPRDAGDGGASARAEAELTRADEISFAAIFARKLANLAFTDATMAVTPPEGDADAPRGLRRPGARAGGGGFQGRAEDGPRARADIVGEALTWAMERARTITAQALATGGRLLVPGVAGNALRVDAVPQERLYVFETAGEAIVSCAILADRAVRDGREFFRFAGYALRDGRLEIRHRAVDASGRPVPLAAVPAWAGIRADSAIEGVDRMPFAFLKCPAGARGADGVYGRPITYGSEPLVAELREHLATIAREYRLTRPMLGLDSQMWRGIGDGDDLTPIERVKRTVQDDGGLFIPVDPALDGGQAPWMIYSPAIRDGAMLSRLEQLCALLEKSVGVSRGILTARETAGATATEIRAANYDTLTWVTAIRDAWVRAMADLAAAADLLAEHFGLSPWGQRGEYAVRFDWDMSLFESSEETFAQLEALCDRGALSTGELRAWVTGE